MANAFELFGTITADTSQLDKGLNTAFQHLRKVESAMTVVEKTGQNLGVSTNQTARNFEKLRDRLAEANAKMDAASNAFAEGHINAKQYADRLNAVDRAIAKVNDAVKDQAAKFATAHEKMSAVAQETQKVAEATRDFSAEINKATSNINSITQEVGQLEQEQKALGIATATAQRATDKMRSALENANNALNEAVAKYNKGEISSKEFEQALQKVANASMRVRTAMQDASARVQDYGAKVEQANAKQQKLANTLDKTKAKDFSAQLDDVGGKLQSVGARMSIGFTAPIVAGFSKVVTAGMDYQDSMLLYAKLANLNVDQMEQVRQKAKELGRDLSLPATSAADAGRAMTELNKAGLTHNQVMGATKGVLMLAAAAQIDEADAAEIAASALNAFNLEGEQAGYVADLLAAAANSSMGEITDMAMALKQSATVFKQNNQNVADLTTAIALMAKAGVMGSDAGTSLKTFMLRLAAPTKEASKAMEELGVSAYDTATKQMLPLPAIIEKFSAKLATLDDQSKAQILQSIFGQDAIRAAQILFSSGVDGFNSMETAVTKVGAAADIAGAKTAGVSGKWDALKSQLETASIEIFENLQEPLSKLLTQLASMAEMFGNAFASLPEGAKTAVIAIVGLLAVIGPVVMVVGTLIESIMAIGAAWTAVTGLFAAGGALAGVTSFFAGLVTAIELVIALLGGEVIAVVALVAAAVIGVAYAIYKAWDTNWAGIADLVTWVSDSIVGVFNDLVTFLSDEFDKARKVFEDFWNENGADIQKAATRIGNFITIIGNYLQQFGQWLWTGLGPIFKSVWGVFVDTLKGVWDIVKGVFMAIWAVIKNVFMMIVHAVNGDWAKVWEDAKNLVSDFFDALSMVLSGLLRIVMAPFKGVLDYMGRVGPEWMQKASELGKNVIDGIVNALSGGWRMVWDAITSLGTTAISAFKKVLGIASPSKVFEALGKDTMQGLIDGINMLKYSVNATLANLIDIKMVGVKLKKDVAEAFAGFLQPLITEMATLKDATAMQQFDAFLNKFRDKAGNLPPAIQKAADALRPFIKGVDDTRDANKKAEEAIKATEKRFSDLEQVILDSIPTIKQVPTVYEQLQNALNDTAFLEKLAEKYQIPIDKLKELLKLRSQFVTLEEMGIKPITPEELAKQVPPGTPTGTRTPTDIQGIELPPPPTEWQVFIDNLTAGLAKLKAELPTFAEALSGSLVNFVEGVGDVFANAIRNWDGTWKGFWKSIKEGMKNLVKDILAQLVKLMVMKAIFKMLGGLGIDLKMPEAATGGLVKAASGGIIRGKGNGTSDSIPAMLSNGEFVVPAKAVKAYGVGFFESLRTMAYNPTMAMAGGGYIGGSPMGRYDNSSVTTNSNVFNINVSGGSNPQVTGQVVQKNILEALRRTERRNR